MKKATHLITVAALSICLNACGTMPTEPTEEDFKEAVAVQKAEPTKVTNDAQTENSNQENKEEKQPEKPIQYGDDNCRNDNDCFLCKTCNTNTHKCEFLGKGIKTPSCGGNKFQCDGQGGCECASHFTGNECNSCTEGFTGANCDQCEPWHFGRNCEPCTCTANMGNTCNEGVLGNGHCSSCWDKGWGDDCQFTSYCEHGSVDQNTGKCQKCDDGWSGEFCNIPNDCKWGKGNFGVNGDGKCQTCTKYGDISTNCETCLGHAQSTGIGKHCDVCSKGWTGPQCDQSICNEEGTLYQKDDGTCVCHYSYEGESCSTCKSSFGKNWGTYMMQTIHLPSGDTFFSTMHDECRVAKIVELNTINSRHYWGYYNKDIENIFIFGVQRGGLCYSCTDNQTYFTWNEAQQLCPQNWRMPTLEEFSEDIQNLLADGNYYGSSLYDYWFATENPNNGNEAYYVKYNKATKTFEFLTANKSETHQVMCVSAIKLR